MAYVSAYSHITIGSLPRETWDQAWFALSSWKGYLQSFPGFMTLRMAARQMDNQDIRLHVVTVWENPEQLEEWIASQWSAESLLKTLDKPAYDIVSETYEDLA